jgi:hypothetical protein
MLSKDLTPNPKAVNIIRPSNSNTFQFTTSTTSQLFNYSSSNDSSNCTFSTASTTTNNMNTHNTPMMRQPSVESNPGLSFFCHGNNIKQQPQQQPLFEKVQAQPPLVISRINLSNFQHRRPTVYTDLDVEGVTTLDDDEDEEDDLDLDLDYHDTATEITAPVQSENMVRMPSTTSFKPGGFGIFNGGLGSFMLRGNIVQQQQQQQQTKVVDEARVNRKV